MKREREKELFVKLLHYSCPFIKITSISFDEEKDQLLPPVSAREVGGSGKSPMLLNPDYLVIYYLLTVFYFTSS